MVFCTYCGQCFARDEHLERHILTHTHIKPFKCFTCHMSFARRDLLQRHYMVHGRNQNGEVGVQPQGLLPKSAGRTPIACNHCAKTKTKCDKKFPCTRCATRNLTCTLRPTRRASKGVQRAGGTMNGGPVNGNMNELGLLEAVNASGEISTATNIQAQQLQGVSLQQIQHTPPNPAMQGRSQSQSESSSVTHSRNSSVSHPVQPISNPNPEEGLLPTSVSQTPPFFDQANSNTLSQGAYLMSPLSPLSNHVNGMPGYVVSTPVPGYDDFVQTAQGQTNLGTPQQYMTDPWNPMAMGNDYDSMSIDPSLMMSMNMDMGMAPLGMIPETSANHSFGPVQSPFQHPGMNEPFSGPQIGSSPPMFYPNNGHVPITDVGVHEPLLTTNMACVHPSATSDMTLEPSFFPSAPVPQNTPYLPYNQDLALLGLEGDGWSDIK